MKTRIFLPFCLLIFARLVGAEPVEIAVTDAKGAPVADALVQVQSFAMDDEYNRTQTLNSAQSDAAGAAKFDLKPMFAGGSYFGYAVAFKSGLALGGVELRNGKRAIQLVAPTTIMGQVTDENGAPVVSAKVELQTLRAAPDSDLLFFYGESAGAFATATTTRTDAAGRWQLGAIMPGATGSVHIEQSQFATTDANWSLADGPLATKLKPEAHVVGQVLKPDGTPLVGVEIMPIRADNGPYLNPIATDAQGRFVATGLSADKWIFSVDLKNEPYVVNDFASLDLKVGENQLAPIALQNGVVVRGTVRETNGAPIDMRVTTSLPGQYMTKIVRTDKGGAFSLRVPAGERSFSLSPSNSTFRDTNKSKSLTIAATDTPQIEWVLERAPVVRGVITDEAGAPVRAPFVFGSANGMGMNGASFKTDENGRFETPVDMDGEVHVLGQVGKNGQYQIVGNNQFNLPVKGELKLVAKLAKPVVFRARAVDADGKPLEGVTFEAMAMSDSSGQTLRLRSDTNGEIQSDNLGNGAQLQGPTATKKGYELRAPIEIVKDGENLTAQLLTFDRRDADASGQILDDTSHIATNARVFAGGIETRTDNQGAWILKGLPPGELLVAALSADGRSFAAARAPLQTPLQLQVAPLVAGDKILAQSILDQLKIDTAKTYYPLKDQLSLPAKQSFMERMKSPETDSPVGLFYQLLNQTNAAETGALESETTQTLLEGWLAMTESADRLVTASMLMEARPDWKDAAGASDFIFQLEEDVNDEFAGQDVNSRKFHVEGVFALAAAFETLGQSESADRAWKNALDWTFKIPDADNNGPLGRDALLTRGVGAFGNAPRLFGKLLNYFDPDSYWHHYALAGIVAPTARARGLQAALRYIEQLRALPDSRPAPVQGDEMPYSPARELPRVVEGAIVAGGQKDPALTLKLARELKIAPDYRGENPPNEALIEAAFWQTPAVAAEIWRAQVPKLGVVEAVQTAVRIKASDEDLARELYIEARARLEKSAPDAMSRFTANNAQSAEFAFSEAEFEPARARYRLEMAWPGALKEAIYRDQLSRYVLAMARLNPQRALEMALEIPNDKENASFDARYSLARALAGENTGQGINSRW